MSCNLLEILSFHNFMSYQLKKLVFGLRTYTLKKQKLKKKKEIKIPLQGVTLHLAAFYYYYSQ